MVTVTRAGQEEMTSSQKKMEVSQKDTDQEKMEATIKCDDKMKATMRPAKKMETAINSIRYRTEETEKSERTSCSPSTNGHRASVRNSTRKFRKCSWAYMQ